MLNPTVLFYCPESELNFVLHIVSFRCSTSVADLTQSSALTMHHTTGTEHTRHLNLSFKLSVQKYLET